MNLDSDYVIFVGHIRIQFYSRVGSGSATLITTMQISATIHNIGPSEYICATQDYKKQQLRIWAEDNRIWIRLSKQFNQIRIRNLKDPTRFDPL